MPNEAASTLESPSAGGQIDPVNKTESPSIVSGAKQNNITPKPEALSAVATEEKESSGELSPREKTSKNLSLALEIVGKKVKNLRKESLYPADPKTQELIAKALAYKGGETTQETSQSLKELMDLLGKISDEDAQKVHEELLQYLRFQNGESTKTFTKEEWDAKPVEEKTQELCGFVFSSEEASTDQNEGNKEDSPINKLFKKEITKLEDKLKNAEKDNLTKVQIKALATQRGMLHAGIESNGKWGAIPKTIALKILLKGNPDPQDKKTYEDELKGLAGKISDDANTEFTAYLKEKGMPDVDLLKLSGSQAGEKFLELFTSKDYDKQLSTEFFGKEMTQKEAIKLLGLDKKFKWGGILMALLVLFGGGGQVIEDEAKKIVSEQAR